MNKKDFIGKVIRLTSLSKRRIKLKSTHDVSITITNMEGEEKQE